MALTIDNIFQRFICPLSKRIISQFTRLPCGHLFDYLAITAYRETSKVKVNDLLNDFRYAFNCPTCKSKSEDELVIEHTLSPINQIYHQVTELVTHKIKEIKLLEESLQSLTKQIQEFPNIMKFFIEEEKQATQVAIFDLNKSFFLGNIENSYKEGFGKIVYQNFNCYKGHFHQDMKHGHGELLYHNGDKYVGKFELDLKSGVGNMFYFNGDVYEGQWAEDKREGHGRLVQHDGDVYEGQFKEGLMEGKGKWIYKAGEVYEGDMRAGLKHGKGLFRMYNGSSLYGEWSGGKMLNLNMKNLSDE